MNEYRRLGEFESWGIGPREICAVPHSKVIALANGGILTHPDTGRLKLNIPDMQPSLAVIDGRDGSLVSRHVLPSELHKLSIRHFATGKTGTIIAAMQYEGPREDHPPLLFRVSQGSVQLMEAPVPDQRNMKNYCGSVAFDAAGSTATVSSPRGNIVTFWTHAGTYKGSVDLIDGSGLAAGNSKGEFVLSSGTDIIAASGNVNRPLNPLRHWPGRKWDNHMATAPRDTFD